MELIRAVAYYRVSTKRQARSGLGLETQEISVNSYRQRFNIVVEKVFYEAESGKKIKNRPVLKRALSYCRKHNTLLIISTLDRLARNVAFIANLIESKVKFIVADKPYADKFELLKDAIDAEREGEIISKRTRECLQAAKRKGVQLGKNGKKLANENKQAAKRFVTAMKPEIKKFQEQGITTVRGIANELNKNKIPTFRGKRRWHVATVHNLLMRIHDYD